MPFDILVLSCFVYVIFLFAIAFFGERRAELGGMGFLRSPTVYTLSLSIYCTAWTFYGAVGYGARSGIEFMTIQLQVVDRRMLDWHAMRIPARHIRGIVALLEFIFIDDIFQNLV